MPCGRRSSSEEARQLWLNSSGASRDADKAMVELRGVAGAVGQTTPPKEEEPIRAVKIHVMSYAKLCFTTYTYVYIYIFDIVCCNP